MHFIVQPLLFLLSTACLSSAEQVTKAIAVIKSNTVNGIITFSQSSTCGHNCGQPIIVTINMTGLVPQGLHGFHIHQFGDLSDGCLSCGPHFNPAGKTHGGPNDPTRHVGDLGNIYADSNGNVVTTFSDSQIKFVGTNCIIGRGVVVHAGTDDLGRGVGPAEPESLKTGNAGGRVGCAVIGLARVP